MEQIKNFGVGLALQAFFFLAAYSLLGESHHEIWTIFQVGFFLIWCLCLHRAITGSRPGGGRVKGYPPEQAKWLRATRRHWNRDMETVGLAIKRSNRRNPDSPQWVVPHLDQHRPVPVGIELLITPIRGRQTTANLVAAHGRLESLWGQGLRMVPSGPANVVVTVIFSAPLDEIRDASSDWMGHTDG